MKNAIDAFHRRVEDVAVEHIPALRENLHAPILKRPGDVLLPATGEVVVDADLGDVLTEQFVDHMRTDQTGAADDKKPFSPDVQRLPSGCQAVTSASRVAATMRSCSRSSRSGYIGRLMTSAASESEMRRPRSTPYFR